MSWFRLIPGDALHGDVLQPPWLPLGTWAGQALALLPHSLEDASHGGDADLGQFSQQDRGDRHFVMACQMLCHPDQVGYQTLGTGMIPTLGDHTQSLNHF